MYIYEDRNGEKLVLRPEGTASVVRSLITNGLTHLLPLKFFYYGPMFRYERPQKGRQRQFHQIGFEYLGTNSYISDVEIITLAGDLLHSLGIFDYTILINSLGSKDTLAKYKKVLFEYLMKYKNKLSNDSQIRLDKNPLRILDSKDNEDKDILENIPTIDEYYSQEDRDFINKVTQHLNDLGIKYKIDKKLVRGLDYYTHSVFEYTSNNLGSQSTILAGGRYNNLISSMGGPDIGACGFATGIERLSLLINNQKKPNKIIAVISKDESCDGNCLFLLNKIKQNFQYGASYMLGKGFNQKLKKVSYDDYFLIIIVGQDEIKNNLLSIKDIQENKNFTISMDNLENFLTTNYLQYKIG